jgi:hypothetical protein
MNIEPIHSVIQRGKQVEVWIQGRRKISQCEQQQEEFMSEQCYFEEIVYTLGSKGWDTSCVSKHKNIGFMWRSKAVHIKDLCS